MGRSHKLREFTPKSTCTIEGWVAAAAIGAGALIGGVATYEGAQKQASASENATNAQEQMFNEQVGNLAPFREAGGGAESQLNYLEGIGTPGQTGQYGTTAGSSTAGGFGSLNTPFNMNTFKSLSPQYGFNLQQGAQGTLNQSSSAQGAESGAALSSLQSYNQNFANNSFNSAFQNYQTQQNNVFNRLSTMAQTGESAASNQASGASTFAGGIGQSLTNTGTAQGAGIAGAGNAIGGGGALLGALMYGQGGQGGTYDPNNFTGNEYVTDQLTNNPVATS